jgi:hypothetical protein
VARLDAVFLTKIFSAQCDFRPIIRQSNTHQRPRLHPPISARITQRAKDKLVDRKVKVPVLTNRKLDHHESAEHSHQSVQSEGEEENEEEGE